MTEHVDLAALVERAMSAGGRGRMRPVIEKELLHYDILFALDQAALLDQLTFQGGTALRLCYGSARFSENLDLVCGHRPDRHGLQAMKSCVADYLEARYGLEVSVTEPKELAASPETRRVGIHRWQIRVVTAPARRDLPKQMIRIEVAEVPAYTRSPQQLRRNYDCLPDGYSDLIILVETLDEIMADKLVSLVDCTAHVRHRDIWDLQWLQQQGAKPDPALIRNKIRDYRVTGYRMNAERLADRLPDIIHGRGFASEMRRFIPLDAQQRTLLKDKFLTLLERETARLLSTAARMAS
ncbi:MAG: nucleotidyl transferase AbiEii/AbiGii toxin family protein [Gammaproteobacteria bacterium]|nr:nucleotidyl transferase AbiEii/AbiGii toxin family protein [Gammaproteobacteria bacterium]